MEAKTLDSSSGYRPYEATRAFWERNGFVHVDTIDPLPDWQPGNPAAIYVAAIRPTRLAGEVQFPAGAVLVGGQAEVLAYLDSLRPVTPGLHRHPSGRYP